MVSRGLIEHYEEFQEPSSLCSSRLEKTITFTLALAFFTLALLGSLWAFLPLLSLSVIHSPYPYLKSPYRAIQYVITLKKYIRNIYFIKNTLTNTLNPLFYHTSTNIPLLNTFLYKISTKNINFINFSIGYDNFI